MDQPEGTKPDRDTPDGALDDVRPATQRQESAARERPAGPGARQPVHRPSRLPGTLAFAAVLVGIAAFAFTGWIYVQGQQEIMRLSTELAQLRVSLDLYARNGGGGETLAELRDRLISLEKAAAGSNVPAPVASALPAAAPAEANQDDCLPIGMRLLVAAGDTYPVCGQSAAVNVGFVDNGYITLADGTSVASGGTMPLPGSACTIAVTSSGDEGLTGYAEIRVSC